MVNKVDRFCSSLSFCCRFLRWIFPLWLHKLGEKVECGEQIFSLTTNLVFLHLCRQTSLGFIFLNPKTSSKVSKIASFIYFHKKEESDSTYFLYIFSWELTEFGNSLETETYPIEIISLNRFLLQLWFEKTEYTITPKMESSS